MKFLLKYTKENIKSNGSKSILLILAVCVAVIMFFMSLVIPTFIHNFHDQSKYEYLGNADIAITAYDLENSKLYSLDRITPSIREDLDYIYGAFAFTCDYSSKDGFIEETISLVAADYDEMLEVDVLKFSSKPAKGLNKGEVIISESMQADYDIKVGELIKINFMGGSYNLQVVGVINKAGFLSLESSAILVSKDQLTRMFPLYTPSLFNIGFAKIKEGVNEQQILAQVQQALPNFNCYLVYNSTLVGQIMQHILVPYYICAFIGCLFCLFIVYLTVNLVFTERVRQFAVLKSMGANNKQLMLCSLMESSFYGVIGGVIGVILSYIVYSIMGSVPALSYVYGAPAISFILPVVFGVVFAIISSFVPALITVRKSIRQTLIKSRPKRLINVFAYFFVLLFVLGLIATPFTKTGDNKELSAVVMVAMLIASLYLVPYVLFSFIYVLRKVFKNKLGFRVLYVKNTVATPSMSMVSRIMCFGLIIVLFLSAIVFTMNDLAYKSAYISFFNCTIVDINNFTENDMDLILQQEGVKAAYETINFSYARFQKENFETYGRHIYYADDVEALYGDTIENLEQTMSNFRKITNPIILNRSYSYVLGYSIGDTVLLEFNANSNYVAAFEVVGFFDSYLNNATGVILDLEQVKSFYLDYGGQFRVQVDVDENYMSSFQTFVRHNFSMRGAEFSDETESRKNNFNNFYVPLQIVKVYSFIVMGLCFTSLIIGLMLSLRENIKYHKTLNTLGMSIPNFLTSFIIQITYMIAVTCALSLGWILLLGVHFPNIMLMMGMLSAIKISTVEYVIIISGVVVLSALVCLVLGLDYRKYFKEFKRDS